MMKIFENKKVRPAKLQRSRGFTVLESIIAIFVLSLSISGVFSAVQQSLSQAKTTKDEIKAFYLAQEAIEIVRNKRDVNQLIRVINNPSNSWLSGISDSCGFNKICRADATNMSLTYCGESWGSCPYIKQNASNYLYGYDTSWPATNFKREVQIESVNANEIAVTVKVSWGSREFKVKTYLLNWI